MQVGEGRSVEPAQGARTTRGELARLEDFIHSSISTFWEIDDELRFTFYSDRDSLDGTAGPSAFVLGQRVPDLVGDEAGREPWASHLADLAARRPFRDYRYSVTTDRGTRHLSSSGRPFYDDDGRFAGYRGVTHDVTELEEARRSAAHHAAHDPLTNLSNRRAWNERLAEVLASSRPEGALLLLDMDGFKRVNDTLGHAAGDELLCRVADALRKVVRDTDVAARLGGDEFAVLLPGAVTREAAGRVASRILEVVRECGEADAPPVSTSVGIALIGSGDRVPCDVLRRADRALYEAKAAGKGVCAFSRETSTGHALH